MSPNRHVSSRSSLRVSGSPVPLQYRVRVSPGGEVTVSDVKRDLSPLKKAGFLTRDSRKKERKKYGQKGARARFQFSKR